MKTNKVKATQEAYRKACAELEERGRLTPDALVEAARAASHPLHACFDWDDTRAAAKWRREQAREIIARVTVEITRSGRVIDTIVYVRDPSVNLDAQGYRNVSRLSAAEKRAAMEYALGQLEGALARADEVAVALGFEEELTSFKRRVKAARAAIQPSL